jgi:class 3 adenylate cyclase
VAVDRPRTRRLGLAFVDPAVEAGYRSWRGAHVLPFTRFALVSGLVGSSTALVAVLLPPLARLRAEAVPLLLLLLAMHAFGLVLLQGERRELVLPYTALTNVVSGICAIGITWDADSFILTGAAVTFISYTGLALIRMPPLIAVPAVLLTSVLAEGVGLRGLADGTVPPNELVIGSALVVAAFFTSLTVGLANERTARHAYVDSLVIEAQRAALFEERTNLARFLAPEVAEAIREHGLDSTLRTEQVILTALCVDLRGFTAYTRTHGPEAMAALLAPYYQTIVECARQLGGTVHSFAGDGALIVLGAPLPRDDHAAAAHALATMLRAEVASLLSDVDSSLGVGIGIASGTCAVGTIGALSRLEYTVIGSAVNLASRLCAQAQDGQILLAPETVAALPQGEWRTRSLRLKGFDVPVRVSVDGAAA